MSKKTHDNKVRVRGVCPQATGIIVMYGRAEKYNVILYRQALVRPEEKL